MSQRITGDPELLALREALAGRYSIERELGRGGMGIVYLAQEVRLDRPVALKVLPPALAERPEVRERFLREARTAARLSHPHVVPIHAVHEIDDIVFIAMAYVEGETLGARVRSRGPLPPREAARVLREVSWALAYAHGQGVIHRDVKPDNILLEAGSGRALVTDFGIAQLAEGAQISGAGSAIATRPTARAAGSSADHGRLAGTVEFMSPEQARGAAVDGRSDLYALGVVGHYILSGRLPFHGATAAAVLAGHVAEPAPRLGDVAPGLPAPLTRALDRCLAKDPDARFGDGEALADALGLVLQDRREVPAALRLFIEQSQEATTQITVMTTVPLGMLATMVLVFALAAGSMGPPSGPLSVVTALMLTLASTPLAMLVHMARRLLRSGHDRDDLIRALRAEIEAHRDELASAYGTGPGRLDRWLKRLVQGGLAVQAGVLGWLGFGPYFPGVVEPLVTLLTGSGIVWVGAGVVAALRHQLRDRVPGAGWLRFWDNPMGRALFGIAGLGLEPQPSSAPYGPTELAIGLAADRLFAALPTAQREAVPELPAVVARLEADAERVRARLADLEDAAAAVDGTDPLGAELRRTRDAAEERLREVVAALETIRVELLRLHAHAGSVEGLTVDLGAAKDVSDDVARMLQGRREVERLLGRRAAPELATAPTPA